MADILWKSFAIIFAIAGFMPFFASKHWFFRGFDFLRIQLAVLQLIWLISTIFLSGFHNFSDAAILAFLIISFIINLSIILPYLPKTKGSHKKLENELIVISVNVMQENQEFDKLINIIKRVKPDILLTMETDKTWENHLKKIEPYFTHVIRVPMDNKYGMHLYSKPELKSHQVHFLISEEHPSIEATFVHNGFPFVFWGIHPPPPSPTEKPTSKQKDAELLKLAKILTKTTIPMIITGDFNNVTWSKTSKLFSKISKLNDARKNRGVLPTFPAHFQWLGFPIDLLFHSQSIEIGRLKTLESIGSDHLPLLFSFAVMENKEKVDRIDGELKVLIQETIKEGKEAAKIENN